MSERNGDRARFQKNRKRKLHHRERIQALMTGRGKRMADPSPPADLRVTAALSDPPPTATPVAVPGEAGWARTGG
jgi:hypothetical protein